MRQPVRSRFVTAFGLAVAVVVAPLLPMPGTGVASAAPTSRPDALVRSLRDATGGTARIDKVQGSDRVRFVGTAAGRPIGRPAGIAADAAPETAAKAFLNSYAGLFGVRDAARELRVTKTRDGNGGIRTVRFQQEHAGVPVFGGDLVVQLEADNDIVAAYGETAGPPATTSPTVTAAAAQATAVNSVARGSGVKASTLRAAEPTLAVYDSRLLGGPGLETPTLVWRTEVTAFSGKETRELVLIDATLGVVALHFEQIADAKDRHTCDNQNIRAATDTCSSPTLVEGTSTEGKHVDAVNAHEFAGDTYDFFFGRFGRDSLDNAGMPLTSVVRYCAMSGGCPYANAYWNGTHMVYGSTFAVDDVVGHELTHGITDNESSLFYYFQSGAINESLSDVFGELIDQTNGSGNDAAGAKWLMGEDLGIGAIRNMANPPAYGDPDKMTSHLWSDGGSYIDAGGVHSNSGVNNKAAFLITDGGTFNGRAVTGLGASKAARVYYDAAMALTSASEYRDLYNIMQQVCTSAIGGAEGITAADCVQVKSALDAVEMSLQPASRTTSAPFAAKCGTDQDPVTRFADNFETTTTNWSTTSLVDEYATGSYIANTGPYGKWWNPQTANPYIGWDPTYASSGTKNLWADDADIKVDSTIGRTADLAVSAETYLQFNHAWGFDAWDGVNYDGGTVEYSTNGGTSWVKVPGTWFTDNGYNGAIYNYWGGTDASALGGQVAFANDSKGYTTSRISLQALAGQSVRFRFRSASDSSYMGYGWFIDDVSVYNCVSVAPTAITATRNVSKVVAGGSVTISGKLTNTSTTAGIAGRSVDVYRRALAIPVPAWTKVATVSTSSTGGYSYVNKPTVNSEFSARYAGSNEFAAATSAATPDVAVAPKVTAAFSRTSVSRTGTSYLSGVVSPKHAGARVYLQRYVSGSWRNVTYKSLSSTSGYKFAVKPGVRGTHKYRVVIKAHADHATGISPTRALSVS